MKLPELNTAQRTFYVKDWYYDYHGAFYPSSSQLEIDSIESIHNADYTRYDGRYGGEAYILAIDTDAEGLIREMFRKELPTTSMSDVDLTDDWNPIVEAILDYKDRAELCEKVKPGDYLPYLFYEDPEEE